MKQHNSDDSNTTPMPERQRPTGYHGSTPEHKCRETPLPAITTKLGEIGEKLGNREIGDPLRENIGNRPNILAARAVDREFLDIGEIGK